METVARWARDTRGTLRRIGWQVLAARWGEHFEVTVPRFDAQQLVRTGKDPTSLAAMAALLVASTGRPQ